jgi:hypothetical protein
MRLLVLNSLIMFDVVFAFFLFLVGVTCFVYYMPGRKLTPPPPSCEDDALLIPPPPPFDTDDSVTTTAVPLSSNESEINVGQVFSSPRHKTTYIYMPEPVEKDPRLAGPVHQV